MLQERQTILKHKKMSKTGGKVFLDSYARKSGRYLLSGSSLEETIDIESDRNHNKDNPNYVILFEEVKKEKSNMNHLAYKILTHEVSLDFEFAKQLQLNTMFSSACLISETERGKAIINLLIDYDIFFIVLMKTYQSEQEIELSLECFVWENLSKVFVELTRTNLPFLDKNW